MKKIAMELIDYQNGDPFPDKLKNEVQAIYSDIENNKYKSNKELIEKSSHARAIEKLIKDRFNLTVLFDKEIAEYIPAAIIPFMSDYLTHSDNVNRFSASVFGNIFRGTNIFKHIHNLNKEKEAYFKRIHNRKGFVDTKYARVGGYLADVKNHLIINFYTLYAEGLIPDETVDIILHEVGHAFTGLESHHRLTTTNATIAGILDDINNNKPDRAYYVFKKEFDPKDLDKAALGNKEEVTDFYSKLAAVYMGELSSQFKNQKYDETNFENLADSFANRFNRGKYLVSGLHKLHVKYGAVMQDSKATRALMYVMEVLYLLIILSATGYIGALLAVALIVFVLDSDRTEMTYDFPKDRYNRIKNGIINNLKNTRLPKALVKDLVDQYKFIDGVIEDSMEFSFLTPKIGDVLFAKNRENNYYINLQKVLENSLNNTLHLKRAELSVI